MCAREGGREGLRKGCRKEGEGVCVRGREGGRD